MKKSILLTIAAFLTLFSYAQKMSVSNVPKPVLEAFKKSYPKVTKVSWEMEKENYEAEFEIAETDYSAVYNKEGKLIETEMEIKPTALPANALNYIKQKYPNLKVKEAAKITDANGAVTYEAELKDMELFFNSNGDFIKLVKE